MQSRKRSRRKDTERHGLAVPIALLALLIVGVVVTGAFYVFSHEPDDGDAGDVSVRQVASPEADLQVEHPQDSIVGDSLKVLPDTSAPGSSTGPVPLSTNPVNSMPVRGQSPGEPLSTPASGGLESAGTPRLDTPNAP